MAHDGREFTPAQVRELEGYMSEEAADDSDSDSEPNYASCLIADGLPEVGEDRYASLLGFLKKAFAQVGPIAENGLHMPRSKAGMTMGFAFVQFEEDADAQAALTTFNGWQMDKKHKVSMNLYSDLAKYSSWPDKFEPPELDGFEPGDDLSAWLTDHLCRDQAVIRYERETEVLFMSTKGPPELDYDGALQKLDPSTGRRVPGKCWTEKNVRWSPQGNYLATFHNRGVLLWGGPKFTEQRRLMHMNVRDIVFTADERFVATWSGHPENPHPEGALVVWDTRTNMKLREFKQQSRYADEPDMCWSPDGAFLARLGGTRGKEMIQVYETPSMALQNKASIRAIGAQELSFPPAGQNILAWWCPEVGNSAACVRLMRLPERKVVREKNLFQVKSCKMHWHPEGTFLCVQVTRVSRTGRTEFTNFQLFRMAERDIPIQMVEVRDDVRDFSWEPKGTRFSIIHGEGSKFAIDFYDMGPEGTVEPAKIDTVEDKNHNRVIWSPNGTYCVMASLQLTACQIDFYDAEYTSIMASQEHYRCTDICWDPSGRLVATVVATGFDGSGAIGDNGYNLWSFQGNAVHVETKSKFFSYEWRPRPKSLLSEKQVRTVIKNLKKYIHGYVTEDRRIAKKQELSIMRERYEQMTAFLRFLNSRRRAFDDEREDRIELRDGEMSDEDEPGAEVTYETFEVVLSEKVEVVSEWE